MIIIVDNNSLITIVVPVYNVESYFDRCINSIINQTYTNLQIILIDDGSTDKSGELCDKYSAIDNRIEVYHQEHLGASEARNVGLKNCKGDYIGFVDSDDWCEPEMFELMLKALKEHDAVRCNYNMHYSKKIISYLKSAEETIVSGRDAVIDMFNHSSCYGHGTTIWNTVFRTSILKNPYQLLFDNNLNYGEDSDLLRQLLLRCEEVILIPNILYNYNRTNVSSTTHSYNFENMLLSADKGIMFLEQNSFPEDFILSVKERRNNTMILAEVESYIAGNRCDTKLIDKVSVFNRLKQERTMPLGMIKYYIVLSMIKFRMPSALVGKVWRLHG